MRKYLLAFIILVTLIASVAAVVSTNVFACQGSCGRTPAPIDEPLPAWTACGINMDCLRF